MTVDLFATDDEAIERWVACQALFVVDNMLLELIEQPLANIVLHNTLEPQRRNILIELLKAKRGKRHV